METHADVENATSLKSYEKFYKLGLQKGETTYGVCSEVYSPTTTTQSRYSQRDSDERCLSPDRHRKNVLLAFNLKYVQTIPDQKRICPDILSFLSRLSCAATKSFQRQYFSVFCPEFCAIMSKFPCVLRTEKVNACGETILD